MRFLRLLPPVFLGLFVAGALGTFFTAGDPNYSIAWAVAIPGFLVTVFVLATVPAARRSATHALARVDSVQRTGQEENGTQELELRLVVDREHGGAYTTSTRLRVPVERLRDYSAGTVHVVLRPVPVLPDARIVPAPDASWTARVEQAKQDPSRIPTTAPAWETGTTSQPGAPAPRARPGNRIVAIGIVALIAALALIPAYGSIGRAFTNLISWDLDGSNLMTGRYQQLAVDEIAAIAGHYDFTRVGFYPGYVLIDGLTSPGAATTDSYEYRYGRATREGPEFIQSSDLQAELFDASELDFSVIGPVVADALGRANVQGVDSTYVDVRRGPDDTGPVILVSIGGAYEDVSMTYGFDGRLIATD